jgi:hypothetical protein
MGIKSNQDRSKEIAQLIRDWITERDANSDYAGWIQMSGPTAYKGVKRKELAALLSVSKTSLNENESSAELRNAEFRWCWEYRKNQETSKAANAELKRAKNGEKNAQKRASLLEGDSLALKAENRLLRNRLAKWEAIERVLQETARAPRMPFTEE